MKQFWLAGVLALMLVARENPFVPVVDETVLPIASNRIQSLPPLKTREFGLPSTARTVQSVTVRYIALDGSLNEKVVDINRSIDWHKPLFFGQAGEVRTAPNKPAKSDKTNDDADETIAVFDWLGLKFGPNRVEVLTEDPKLRILHVPEPFKIVIDFKRNARFLTRHYALKHTPFVAADIGNHKGYYRLVLTLDAHYRYRVTKTKDGYLVRVR